MTWAYLQPLLFPSSVHTLLWGESFEKQMQRQSSMYLKMKRGRHEAKPHLGSCLILAWLDLVFLTLGHLSWSWFFFLNCCRIVIQDKPLNLMSFAFIICEMECSCQSFLLGYKWHNVCKSTLDFVQTHFEDLIMLFLVVAVLLWF